MQEYVFKVNSLTTHRAVLLKCGCRAEKAMEGTMEVLSRWSACPAHEGASSGQILAMLNEQQQEA